MTISADSGSRIARCAVPLIAALLVPFTTAAQEPAPADEFAPGNGVRIQDLTAGPPVTVHESTAPEAPIGPPGKKKNVAGAFFLALLFPGAGLYYTEKYAAGVMFTIGGLGFEVTCITLAILLEDRHRFPESKYQSLGAVAGASCVAAVGMKLAEIIVSPIAAHRHNDRVSQGAQLASVFAAPVDTGGLIVGAAFTMW